MAKTKSLRSTYTSEYGAWTNMNHRCHNEKHKAYPNYGKRGITVCSEWRFSFETFINDMKKKPINPTNTRKDEYSIDRIDNNKGYSKDNCKWSTRLEQQSNLRKKKPTTYTDNNETRTVQEWAKLCNVTISAIHKRYKAHKSVFKNKVIQGRRSEYFLTINNVTKPVLQWANENNLRFDTLHARMLKNIPTERLLLPPWQCRVYALRKKKLKQRVTLTGQLNSITGLTLTKTTI